MISINNEQSFPIDTQALQNDAQIILKFLGYATFDLGILLTDIQTMHEFNKKYRDQDKSTDILSFAYHQYVKAGEKISAKNKEDKNLGDIIMCPEYIHKDLPRWNELFEKRIQILLVHGVCHLLGYEHINDEDYELMRQKEAEILAVLAKKIK